MEPTTTPAKMTTRDYVVAGAVIAFVLYLLVLIIGTAVANIGELDSPCHDPALRPIAIEQGARC